MQTIVEIGVFIVVACVMVYLATKGMRKLMKESETREKTKNTGDAYIKRGYDPEEQQKRRIEENR